MPETFLSCCGGRSFASPAAVHFAPGCKRMQNYLQHILQAAAKFFAQNRRIRPLRCGGRPKGKPKDGQKKDGNKAKASCFAAKTGREIAKSTKAQKEWMILENDFAKAGWLWASGIKIKSRIRAEFIKMQTRVQKPETFRRIGTRVALIYMQT